MFWSIHSGEGEINIPPTERRLKRRGVRSEGKRPINRIDLILTGGKLVPSMKIFL